MSETPTEILSGHPLLAWICWWKRDHRWGPWHGTYQPHVESRDCRRCGAEQARTIAWR